MKTPLKVAVEPLSQQRWAKIERSLFTRLESEPGRGQPEAAVRRRQPVLVWLGAAAMLAVAALFFAWGALWQGRGTVDNPSRITTGATPSHLALPGLALDVEPESEVVVREGKQGTLIVVDHGSIVCDVAPRTSDEPLIVQAGGARIRVVGTRFSVRRVGESARVAVERGVVEVSTGGQSYRLTAGAVWPPPGPPDLGHTTAVAASAATPATSTTPIHEAAPSKPRARAALPVDERLVEPQPSPQAQFEEAARLERSDPGRASALYRGLSGGSDSWAQNALFAQGRLEATRGNRVEARRLLELYLARFPKGPNAADARAVLQRLR